MASEQRLSAVEAEAGASELLSRLEWQSAESGRLRERVQTLEHALRTERDARRRATGMLTRERKAAEDIHARAELAEATVASQAQALDDLRQASLVAEHQIQLLRMQVAEAERDLAVKSRPVWRKLLRRPPAG